MKTRLLAMLFSAAALQATAASAETADLRQAVHNNYGNLVLNSFSNCVRSNFVALSDACAEEILATPQRHIDIAQEERTVYFDFNKASISPEAAAKLDSLATRLNADTQVSHASIHGYADRIGTRAYNDQLSKRRAENVRKYLTSRGFIKGQVAETRWMGESVPVTNCPDSLSREELIACLAKDRRVEVEIDYLQPK